MSENDPGAAERSKICLGHPNVLGVICPFWLELSECICQKMPNRAQMFRQACDFMNEENVLAWYTNYGHPEKIWNLGLKFGVFSAKISAPILVQWAKLYIPRTLNNNYLLWHTQCMCSKRINHGLNNGLLFSLFKFFGWNKIEGIPILKLASVERL